MRKVKKWKIRKVKLVEVKLKVENKKMSTSLLQEKQTEPEKHQFPCQIQQVDMNMMKMDSIKIRHNSHTGRDQIILRYKQKYMKN